MAKDYKVLAKSIFDAVGGKENINSSMHCATRLRLVLNDEGKADDAKVKAIEGVRGLAKAGGQYQIIIGTDVEDLFTEFIKLDGSGDSLEARAMAAKEKQKETNKKTDNAFNRFCKAVSGIIMPFLPALIGAGLVKALLTILTMTGVTTDQSGFYQILYAGADAFFYFLPIMCAFSAGKKFGGNPFICAAIAAALIYPDILTAYNEQAQISFLGIPVKLMNYTSGIFPAMASSWLACTLEKFFKKVLPKAVASFLLPFLVVLITTPITFLVIGPVLTLISNGLADGSKALYAFCPPLAGALIGGLWQLVVIFGLHYAFIPILINNISTMGNDPVNALMGVTVFAVSGAAIGFALKMKDKRLKADGFSTGLTGLLGITEPLIFGILVPFRKPFLAAMIGGAIGGAVNALMGGTLFGFVGGGLGAIPFTFNPDGTMGTFIAFVVSSALAFVISLIMSFVLMKGTETAE